jgi:beta-phosphoglucomutase
MTEALIFDMDGTIVDNISFHKQAWLTFLKKYNIDLSPDELSSQNYGTIEEMIIRFFGKDLSEEKVKDLGFEKEAVYRSLYQDDIKELIGFTKLLKEAKRRGLKTGLATMSNAENVNFIINSLNIREYFDVMVDRQYVKQGKPHPEIYELILSKLNVEARNAIAFEDSKEGITSALKAGMNVVGICTSHKEAEFISWGVEYCVANFEEYLDKYFQ